MLYRIEITDQDEFIVTGAEYRDKKDCMIHYNQVIRNVNRRYKLHGCTMRIYHGFDENKLQEIKKYTVEF